ncbi:molybdopterin-dependent oxidoreductase [Methylobacterium sp. WCS2018Hpa-22]|uniref:molybdopterin-dependent oxidoreductase n=1 Tax=Methylobacterium sp. WCS2018Hpa-22 TaxID=3073633 RepID=UPI0038620C57
MTAEHKPGYCALCTSSCGVIYTVENDRITGVRNDPDHPTGQSMCLKGKSAAELLDSTERLTSPLKRTRPKGDPDPGWKPISWEEALDAVAGRLRTIKKETGAHTVAFGITTPSGTPMADSAPFVERFVFQFGSPNISYASELCNWHKENGHAFTFGRGMPTPDYIHSDLIILWGHNPTNTVLSQAHAIGEARKAGAKLIVVDPRETALAREADVWLRVRPSSDAALALGIAGALIDRDQYDHTFVSRWSNGALLVRDDNGLFLRGGDLGLTPADAYVYWDHEAGKPVPLAVARPGEGRPVPSEAALRGRFLVETDRPSPIPCRTAFDLYAEACARFSIDETSRTTWIEPALIRAAADLIADSARTTLHSWTGVEQHANATQSMRAMSCLYALTGSYDSLGGNRIFGALPFSPVNDPAQLPPEQLEKALGRAERPIGPPASGWISTRNLYRSILDGAPYKVRAYVSFGANPLLSQADTTMAEAAFRALEFHVHCDLFMTPTAGYADIVLPVNTLWEREALRIGFEISPAAAEWVQLRSRMVSPRGDCRSDAEIVFALAERLGMAETFYNGSLDRGWNAMLEPLGLTTQILRDNPAGMRIPLAHPTTKYTKEGFATSSGLVELYSELMHVHGAGALPDFDDHDISQPSQRYPYVLTNAKSGYYCHSQHRNIASLRRKARQPTLDIATSLAVEKGIQDGDWVVVTTRTGNARFRARIDGKLDPRVMVGDYGWWQGCTPLGQATMPVRGPRTSNFNALVDARNADPVSGSVPMRSVVCDLHRESRAGRQPERWKGFRAFGIQRIVEEAADVKRIHLAPIGGGKVPGFEAGQYISLQLNMGDGLVTRSYSLVDGAGTEEASEYVICVRNARRPDSEASGQASVSAHLVDRARAGDTLGVQMPQGSFLIPVHSERPVILYAGGIGITPFMAALDAAAAQSSASEFYLLYNNRNSATHVFRQRLGALKTRLPGLKIIDYYSKPFEDDHVGSNFDRVGYISPEALPAGLLARRPLHYLCGGDALMRDMTRSLVSDGAFPFDIMQERFVSPMPYTAIGKQSYVVTFARSGQSLTWHAHQGPLLAFAEQSGITVSSGCRVGQCENCTVRIVSGQVRHLHDGEPPDDHVCISCQAVPTSDLTLDA